MMQKEEAPWYVHDRIPVSQVRKWLEDLKTRVPPRSFIAEGQWRAFLHRRRAGKLKAPAYGNTGVYCPKCGRRLRHFYITKRKDVLERAKEDPKVHRLISRYVCWPCAKTYSRNELEKGVAPSPYEGMCVRFKHCKNWEGCKRRGIKFLFPKSVSKGKLPKGVHEI